MSCDVTRHGGGFGTVVTHGGHATFTPSGAARFFGDYALDVRLVSTGAQLYTAAVVNVADSDPVDRVVVVNPVGDIWRSGFVPFGEHPLALKPHGDGLVLACVSHNGHTLSVVVLSPRLTTVSATDQPIAPTTQGILDWADNGVVFVDGNTPKVIGGVQFSKPMTRGAWTVGLHDDNRLLLYDHDDEQVLAAPVRSQKLARLALDPHGNPLVAATGENTFLTLDHFSPLEDDMPASLLPLLQQVRATYPSRITRDQCVEILNTVAWRAHYDGFGEGWGLFRKPGQGETHGVRYDGTPCSVDWLVHLPSGTGGDVFKDASTDDGSPAPAIPTWPTLEPVDTSVFVPPINPQGQPAPPDPEPPPPPQPPSGDLEARVAALESRLAAVESRRYVVQLPVLPVK